MHEPQRDFTGYGTNSPAIYRRHSECLGGELSKQKME